MQEELDNNSELQVTVKGGGSDSRGQSTKKDSIIKNLIGRPKEAGGEGPALSKPLFNSLKQPSTELPARTYIHVSDTGKARAEGFGNFNGALAEARAGFDFRAQGQMTADFAKQKTESSGSINHLMAYEIVDASDNEEDDEESESLPDRESNQTYGSRKPSLYQNLEERRQKISMGKRL